MDKKINSALISVFNKEGLEPILSLLDSNDIKLYSTGGTKTFIEEQGYQVTAVEDITDYPSIFGGRVKTLHPKIFGGILHRRGNDSDLGEKEEYNIPAIDLVIVDLYPFEETVKSGASEEHIIEKIDIGGISLIRAAAKNFRDVLIVSSKRYYQDFLTLLQEKEGVTSIEDRKRFAKYAFGTSSHYDSAIFKYFSDEGSFEDDFKLSIEESMPLRYGENPHQNGNFKGNFNEYFDKLSGKDISYNNLIDIDAAVQLMGEFEGKTAFGILKHNNACGFALGENTVGAYVTALASDPLSAFGGILVTNSEIDLAAAEEIDKLFFEILIAPNFQDESMAVLTKKKNRILLKQKKKWNQKLQVRSLLNGVVVQDYDLKTDEKSDLKIVTEREPTEDETEAMIFASKICKHSKSNTIVLANKDRMISSGVGQTSRVDALQQAIEKANKFELPLEGATMASDAFFPFPDCVEIASKAGIKSVIQPGGSVKDQLSTDFCNQENMTMVHTGFRHFKH